MDKVIQGAMGRRFFRVFMKGSVVCFQVRAPGMTWSRFSVHETKAKTLDGGVKSAERYLKSCNQY